MMTMNDNHIEAVASALAIADGYNPNDIVVERWTENRDKYREMAVKAMEAMQPYVSARIVEKRMLDVQRLLFDALRILYDVPTTPEIIDSIQDIRTIHGRLGRVREEMERIQNDEAPEAI